MMYRSATVPGKVAFLRQVWEKSEAVFEAVDKEGTKAVLCRALAAISFFGAGREESREPRFFSKELAEDLIECGIVAPCSASSSYVVIGRGAVEGLERMLRVDSLSSSDALGLTRGLRSSCHSKRSWSCTMCNFNCANMGGS